MPARAATAGLLAALGAGCASAAARAPVDVPAGRPPTADEAVARAVGRLLGGDGAASRAAETELLALDAAGRAALARHAARIPTERDPRLLGVLDAHGLLPPMSDDEAVALRLWQDARGEPGPSARARAALVDLAHRAPAALARRLGAGRAGSDVLAVALGEAGARAAAAEVIAYYAAATTTRDRKAAAIALAQLVAPAPGPVADADGAERVRQVDRMRRLLGATEGSRDTP